MQLLFRHKNLFLLFLIVISLLPYLIICFYALPFADDFCFGWTASEKISFVQKFLNQYLYWNGRFTSDVLVNFHPLVTGELFLYRSMLFLSLAITPIIIYFFISNLFSDVQTGNPKLTPLIISFTITLFYLNYMPNITEGIYWYIGIVNYHLGNLCLLIQVLLFSKSFSSERKMKFVFQFLSLLFLIFSIGFNEIGALLIPLFYFWVILFNSKSKIRDSKFLFAHFTVAVVASLFVFLSPGNFVREKAFTDRYDFFHSLLYSLLQTIRFIGTWSFSIPFVALSLIVLAKTDKIQNKFITQVDYRIILVFLLFTAFAGSFLPYFATGILGQHRTINYVFFFFILLCILFMISVSKKFSLHQKFVWLKKETITTFLFCLSIVFMLFSGNSLKIISDFREENFRKYENAFFERQKLILQKPEPPILPLDITPKTFQIADTRGDTSWWVDKCMKNFYTETKTEVK